MIEEPLLVCKWCGTPFGLKEGYKRVIEKKCTCTAAGPAEHRTSNPSLSAELAQESFISEIDRLAARCAELEAEVLRLRKALHELHATVMGECPALLNEDSGGDAVLALAIEAALSRPTADRSAEPEPLQPPMQEPHEPWCHTRSVVSHPNSAYACNCRNLGAPSNE